MTSPAGFLDFFILEASEYIEQLDGLVLRGGSEGPDAEGVLRAARALRGSATMAKLTPFADLAAMVERVARALRDGALSWDAALGGAVTAAVDDLKLLLHAARNWSPAEEQRARARAAELARFAPQRVAPPTPTAPSGLGFLAGEAANIAAGLDLVAARPNDREGAGNVLRRVRALRGVAGIREVPLLPEIMEAAELGAKALELGDPLGTEALDVLRAAASLLRDTGLALREGRPADPASPRRDAFFAALDRFQDAEASRERIVPIAELFTDDAGPHVVSAAANPPTSPRERFHLELVSQVEHMRGLLADARQAPDAAARERMSRELRRTMRTLGALAESFGEREVARFIAARADAAKSLDAASLATLDAMVTALARPQISPADLRTPETIAPAPAPVSAPTPPRAPAPSPPQAPAVTAAPVLRGDAALAMTPVSSAAQGEAPRPAPATPPSAPPSAPVPAPPTAPPAVAAPPRPMPAPSRPATPAAAIPAPGARRMMSGEQLAVVLDSSIAGLDASAARPLTPPLALPEQPPIPIDSLLYRGRAALERAVELKNELRRGGGTPSVEALSELFDLLDLALAG